LGDDQNPRYKNLSALLKILSRKIQKDKTWMKEKRVNKDKLRINIINKINKSFIKVNLSYY
jgi:hypothetical protein